LDGVQFTNSRTHTVGHSVLKYIHHGQVVMVWCLFL